MVNWLKGTWEKGDKLKYNKGKGVAEFHEIEPGLYWYSGLGSGSFFRPDGTVLQNCSPREAGREAELCGIPKEYHYIDSFIISSFSSVMG